MTLEEIERLAALCAQAGIGEIELAKPDFALRLRVEPVRAEPPRSAAGTPEAEVAFKGVRAPGVGVFRRDHPTTGHPIAETGQAVQKGDTVGVLQVGPYLRAVVAPADGVLGAALVEDGVLVGYGTPLYGLT